MNKAIYENKDYSKVNRQIRAFIKQGVITPYIGIAKAPIPVEIKSVNRHALKHGVTRKDAQKFINNAVVMFDQETRSLYISSDGSAVILDKDNRLITAYRKEEYDLGIKAILEVVKDA